MSTPPTGGNQPQPSLPQWDPPQWAPPQWDAPQWDRPQGQTPAAAPQQTPAQPWGQHPQDVPRHSVGPNPSPQPNPYGQPNLYGQPGWHPAPQWQLPTVAQPLPVELRQHPDFWRAPRWSWWRPVVAAVVGIVLFLVAQTLAVAIALVADAASGRMPIDQAIQKLGTSTTPAFFAANNVSLALLIPIAMLVAWWLTGQRPKWLTSVAGGFRWGWFARCLAILAPLWLVYVGIEWWAISQTDEGLGLHVNKDTWFLLGAILLTTPLQAAGEEYGFRGLLNRAAASFFGSRTVGLIVGLLFSSALFMLAHGAGDRWLNLYYFCFGAIACILAWRTGGLEASIAMHVVNNLLSEASLPFSDISEMFNREAGTADASVLIGIAVPLLGLALVEWQARRQHVVVASAPAAEPAIPAQRRAARPHEVTP